MGDISFRKLAVNRNVDEILPILKSIISPDFYTILPDFDDRLVSLSYETLFWLIHSGNGKYINEFILCAISYKTRRTRATRTLLAHLKSFIEWSIPKIYPDFQSFKPNEAILMNFHSDERGRGNTAYTAYSTFYKYQQVFLESIDGEQAKQLDKWLLPRLAYSRTLGKLRKKAEKQGELERKAIVHLLNERLIEISNMVKRRLNFIIGLQNTVDSEIENVKNDRKEFPIEICVDSIDNNEKWTFRVWDYYSWMKLHYASYSNCTNRKNKKRSQVTKFDDKSVFLQFVGNIPQDGWFLEAASLCALQCVDTDSPIVLEFCKKNNLKREAFSTGTISDFVRVNKKKSGFLRHASKSATGTKEDSKTLFFLNELVNATYLAVFAFFTYMTTAMRVGEFQQITLDLECLEPELLDFLSGNITVQPPANKRCFYVFPKNEEENRERYQINELVLVALKHWMEVFKKHHQENFFPVDPNHEHGFSHKRKYVGKKIFILQWNGVHMLSSVINACLKFLFLNHGVYDPFGKPIDIFSHLFRHEAATEYAKQIEDKGISFDKVVSFAKHVNEMTTKYYSEPSMKQVWETIEPKISNIFEGRPYDKDSFRNFDDLKRMLNEKLKTYGMALRVEAGICAEDYPCIKKFRCGSCIYYCPDPARLGEVVQLVEDLKYIEVVLAKNGDLFYLQEVKVLREEWEHTLLEIKKFGKHQPLITVTDKTKFLLED